MLTYKFYILILHLTKDGLLPDLLFLGEPGFHPVYPLASSPNLVKDVLSPLLLVVYYQEQGSSRLPVKAFT